MDGLSAASSIIAVIQISSQIFDLFRTYYINVKDARKEIQRLRNEITALQDVLVNVADLAEEPNSASLKTLSLISQENGPVQQCRSELMALVARLEPGDETSKMRQFGLRALKWPFTSKEVDKILVAIERHKSSFSLALTTDQTALSLTIAQGLSDITQQLKVQKLEDDREMIIQWLSTTDPSTNFHAACNKCQPGTGRWLLEREEFKLWQTASNSFIWLYGIPGSGKTILSAIIIQELQHSLENRPRNVLAYFYFDFITTAKQELSQCLASIVVQLCAQTSNVPQEVRKSFERCSYGKHRPSIEELKEMLLKLIEYLDNVFIILDALDECPRNGERSLLLSTIYEVVTRSHGNLHIFVTSRWEPDIEEILIPLLTYPAISLQSSEVDFDIKMHISRQLATDKSLKKWSPDVKAEIENSLTEGANGMFRWVDCQLDALKRCLKVSLIRKALQNLPKTLDDTYSRVFSAIDEAYRDDAKNALVWLAFAECPLLLTELAEATIICPSSEEPFNPDERFPDPQNILQILSSLVTVSSRYNRASSGQGHSYSTATWEKYISEPEDAKFLGSQDSLATVTLSHYSVKEYLISERIKSSAQQKFSLSPALSNTLIAESCLDYIIYYAKSPLKCGYASDLDTFPLLKYAAVYWSTHINQLPHDEQKKLSPLALKLLLSPSNLSSWLGLNRHLEPLLRFFVPIDPTLTMTEDILLYAADMGLLYVAQELIDRGSDPNAKDDYSGTALHRVSTNGSAAMALLLLKNGAAVDPKNGFDQTPLHLAAWSENEDMVDLLLEWGADINARNENGETALHYAASDSPRMLKHLLGKGASYHIQSLRGETAIDWAIGSDSRFQGGESVDILVKAGAVVTESCSSAKIRSLQSGRDFGDTICASS